MRLKLDGRDRWYNAESFSVTSEANKVGNTLHSALGYQGNRWHMKSTSYDRLGLHNVGTRNMNRRSNVCVFHSGLGLVRALFDGALEVKMA